MDGATAFTSLDVDDQASGTIDEVVDNLEELDGSTATATIEVDDEVTDVAEEALEALENIDETFTATIETEGGQQAEAATTGIAANLGRIGGAGGLAGLSAAGMLLIGQNASDAVLEVKSLAEATGATLEETSRLKEVWELAGGTIDTLERNIIRANDQIRQSPALASQLGIQIGANTSSYEVFVGAVNALNSGQLTQTERLALAMDVFGSRGILMLNDLQTRVGDLDSALAGVSDYEIINDEDVAAALEFQNQMDTVSDVIAEIARDLMPSIASTAQIIATILESWPVEQIFGALEDGLGALEALVVGEETFDPVVEGLVAVNDLLGINGEFAETAAVSWANLQYELDAGRANSDQAANSLEHLAFLSGKSEEEVLALAQGLEVEAAAALVAVSSIGDINQALQDFDDQTSHTRELWDVVMADFADNQSIDTASEAWNRLKDMLGLTDEQMSEIANQKLDDQLKDEAAAAQEAADAEREHQEALVELGAELVEVARNLDTAALRAAGFTSALDQLNASSELTASQEVIGFVDNMNALAAALHEASHEGTNLNEVDLVPDSWGEVLNMPEELGPVQEALVAFRESVQSEMAQAFEQGGQAEVLVWAENTRNAIVTSLNEAGVTSEAAVNQVLSALGLLPDQIDMAIAVSGQEQALATLALLQGAIDGLPIEVQLQIAAVAATDPLAALELAIAGFQEEGIAVPVELTVLAEQLRADVAAAAAAAPPPVITPVVDTTDAGITFRDFAAEDRHATVDAVAETAVAAADTDAFVGQERLAHVSILVDNFAAARDTIDLAAKDRISTVDIVTGTIALPSSAELRNQIGTVRVPVQAYWNTRIEGNRPV